MADLFFVAIIFVFVGSAIRGISPKDAGLTETSPHEPRFKVTAESCPKDSFLLLFGDAMSLH